MISNRPIVHYENLMSSKQHLVAALMAAKKSYILMATTEDQSLPTIDLDQPLVAETEVAPQNEVEVASAASSKPVKSVPQRKSTGGLGLNLNDILAEENQVVARSDIFGK